MIQEVFDLFVDNACCHCPMACRNWKFWWLFTLFKFQVCIQGIQVFFKLDSYYWTYPLNDPYQALCFPQFCKFCFISFFKTSPFCCFHTLSQKLMRKNLKLSPYSFFTFVNANQKHILIPQDMLIIKNLD